ncbi:MAG: 4'-phosphopantetheinyl transferase superfamily protein [Trichloromonas sp.]|nr:4'-phosphopantetheinyl transferase superfamily protein [Trichloromonas sp.]
MNWRKPPARPRLDDGDLHLWRFRLDLPPETISDLRPLLSPDETARAERLRIPSKKHEFIAARGRLRQILARYLDSSPAALRFAYGPAGKPALAFPTAPLAFNLAHAGCWGLLGVCAQGEIGVDVEWLQRPVDIGQIAGWAFDCDLVTELAVLPPGKKNRRFFQLWTAREARLKALGTGFTAADHAGISGLATGNFFLEDDYYGAWSASVLPSHISYWHDPSTDSE